MIVVLVIGLVMICLLPIMLFWIAVAAPAAQWFKFRRRVNRVRRHRCEACDYDLRATDERCPECGRVVPAPKSVVDALEEMTR